MKKRYPIALAALAVGAILPASAQYYNIANQVSNMIQAPLNGSGRYKGFVDVNYTKGLGKMEADFLEFSTTQGYQYNSWFFMGAGLGASIVFSHQDNNVAPGYWDGPEFTGRTSKTSGVMIPLFTDFRFTPMGDSAGLYVDIKLGCSFLVGKDYLRINRGYLTNQEYFYLKPSIGFKIPCNSQNSKQAIDIGVSYQLLTSNYWSGYYSDQTLNGLGVNLGFEW